MTLTEYYKGIFYKVKAKPVKSSYLQNWNQQIKKQIFKFNSRLTRNSVMREVLKKLEILVNQFSSFKRTAKS